VDALVRADSERNPTRFIFQHGSRTGFVAASGSGCATVAGDAHATELRCSSSGITRVRYQLGDRNDIAHHETIVVPATMDGGAGQDSLHAGFNDDFLIGGSGGDTLRGYEGDDTIDAQAPGYPFEDNDLIFCGEGPVGDPDPNDRDRAFLDDLDEQHVDCETVSTERAPAPP
jgi:Ca2+-binding RTX toxin-like protein